MTTTYRPPIKGILKTLSQIPADLQNDAHGPESPSELYRRACTRVKRYDPLALLLAVSIDQIPQETFVKSCG